MRLHRFFVTDEIADQAEITIIQEELLHQWKNVFRLRGGDQIILCDDRGSDFLGSFVELTKKRAVIKIIERTENKNKPKREIYLFASVVKKDTFEWVLEKATELGVSRIIPVLSDRSEKKSINFERAKKIVSEAAEQSGRATLPRIYELLSLKDAVTQYTFPSIAWHVEGKLYSQEDIAGDGILCVYIGPEGGWSAQELELFTSHNIPLLSLGATTPRAETAVISVLSLLLLKS